MQNYCNDCMKMTEIIVEMDDLLIPTPFNFCDQCKNKKEITNDLLVFSKKFNEQNKEEIIVSKFLLRDPTLPVSGTVCGTCNEHLILIRQVDNRVSLYCKNCYET